MKRFDINTFKNRRKHLHDVATTPSATAIEMDAETLNKFLSKKLYTGDDITNIAKTLFEKYRYDFDQQFKILENLDTFEDVEIETGKPVFVVYAKRKNCWVLFCLVENTVLYKDPCGAPVSYKLEKKLSSKFSNVKFKAQTQVDQDNNDEESYGPLTLRNLEKVLRLNKTEPEKLLKNFEKLEFAHSSDLYNERLGHITELVTELAQKKKFKDTLKDFVDKIPIEMCSDVLDYRKVLEEELSKDEDKVDHAKIREAREKSLSKVDTFRNNYEINKKQEEDNIKDYELNIQKEFPEEMKKLTQIFQIMMDTKTDEELYTALQTMCHLLNIDYDKLKFLFEYQTKKRHDVEEKTLAVEDIKTIVANLPPAKPLKPQNSTPLEQLLEELVLGKDPEDSSPTQRNPIELNRLKEKYHSVKDNYKKWENAPVESIVTWAKQKKGSLGTTDEAICEAVAIMDRAFNLLTTWRLRDPQILAALIFLDSKKEGRLCQIQTGEGKTIIVSLLAVVKVLQGLKVDVITSNAVLATDGMNECKTFYSVFGVTFATNNPATDGNQDFKLSYSADVLYGTISNFQFDYLRDTFEGFTIRNNRKFGQVILDEVDSMLVDNGGHIAKLAEPFPGMECLRYIYIKIWQELHKAEKSFEEEITSKINEMVENNEEEEKAKKYILDVVANEEKMIAEKVKNGKPNDFPLIPQHLKPYVDSKIDVWIRNAIYAKHYCFEHQQYRIISDSYGEKVVVPVDYMNTGVTLRNTIWSRGLHQFVQLKHNLRLTFESLTNSFISNIGYIKKYKDENIYGMTGTLGSRAEQELLSHIYKVNYAKIPTYKPKNFHEVPSLVVEDNLWSKHLAVEVTEMIEEGRAVLVICETEHDLNSIKDDLKKLKKIIDFKIRTYANEEMAKETKNKVKIGDVILATNIAGRGTNFKTDKSLEENGGLHVCVGFLPYNLRVEGQAFGRTSRQGNKGTANLIIRRSEVEELGIVEASPEFSDIKKERDALERRRLDQIDRVLVKEIIFKDEIFELFSDFQRELKEEKKGEEFEFVLKDLREFWAFWLEKKNFKLSNITNTTPRQEFDKFINEADTIIKGNINHNPYYCIGLAAKYLENDNIAEASKSLKRAQEISGDLLTGAQLKLFQIAIMNGSQIMERFKKAIAAVFFVHVEKNEDYKTHAIDFLNKAKEAVDKEIAHIDKQLSVENADFREILIENKEENYFLKHIYSRMCCLKIHDDNINKLLEMLKTETEGLDLDGVATTTMKNLSSISKENNSVISNFEVKELHLIGIDALYSLKKVYDVPNEVIVAAQAQILAGITALTIGLCFPPAYPFVSPVASTLISEGLIDIVMEIVIKNGNEEFNAKDFVKDKIISYAVSIITFGISAVAQCTKILATAVKLCRKFSTFLRKSKYLKTLSQKLAKVVDKLGDVIDKALDAAKFRKLSKSKQLTELAHLKGSNVEKFERLGGLKKLNELQHLEKVGKLRELRRIDLLWDFTKELTFELGKRALKGITEEKVLKPLVRSAVFKFVEQLREKLELSLRQRESVMMKLKTTPEDKIVEVVDGYVEAKDTLETCEKIATDFLGQLQSSVVDAVVVVYYFGRKGKEIDGYVKGFAVYLDNNLKEGKAKNDVNAIIESVCTKVTDRIHTLLYDIFDAIVTLPKNAFKKYAIPIIKDKFNSLLHEEVPIVNEADTDAVSTSEAIVPYRPPLTEKVEASFKVLGLGTSASVSEIRKRYKSLYLKMEEKKNLDGSNRSDNFGTLRTAFERSTFYAKGKKQEEGSTGVIIASPDGVLTLPQTE